MEVEINFYLKGYYVFSKFDKSRGPKSGRNIEIFIVSYFLFHGFGFIFR